MNWRVKAVVQGSLAGLAVGAIIFAGSAAGATATEAAGPRAQASIGGGAACRWELAHVGARHDGPGQASLRTATMLLDQCSGRTWILVYGPRDGLGWRAVDREFRPE